MVISRAQALSLLTDPEMVLFGESRNPTLRSFNERELTRRVDRVRKLRDRSRDLLQRQRLSSRERTGSKGGASGAANQRTARKAEVLNDVLQRFESRLHQLERSEQPGAGRKASAPASRKAAKTGDTAKAKKAVKKTASAAKKAAVASRKSSGAAKKTSGGAKTTRAEKAVGKTAGKTAGKAAAPVPRKPRKSAVTAEQALASTRELLEAMQQRQRSPDGYPGNGNAASTQPGYQSAQAKAKALDLHAGEVRMEPIHGSISTRGRKNQAKRDRS